MGKHSLSLYFISTLANYHILLMIWHKKDLLLQEIIHLGKGTMGEHIGIVFTEVGPDYIIGTMPVDGRTRQPYGLLHGGASCVLAETLGSVASAQVFRAILKFAYSI